MTKVLNVSRVVPKTAKQTYKTFFGSVVRNINKGNTIDKNVICGRYCNLSRMFMKEGKLSEFTGLSKGLMELLVSNNLNDIAGMICSILIKLNANNPEIAEDLAIRGMAMARRMHDPVHVASRVCELNKILLSKEPGSDRHIKYLRIENKALKDVCRNYEGDAGSRFKTIKRELAPLARYELRLCNVKLDIATYTVLKDRQSAMYEYEQAKLLYDKNKDSCSTDLAAAVEGVLSRIRGFERRINKIKIAQA